MATPSSENIYEEFFKVAEAGDEQAAKEFLLTYLKRFPQKEKDEIIAAFFEDALQESAGGATAAAEFQKQVIETVEGLEGMKKKLEDKDRLLQIKETI